MRQRQNERRAFAATAAIVLMGLIGVALLMLTGHVGAEARRARDEAAEAQTRQLLVAAHRALAAGEATVTAPPELAERGAEVRIEVGREEGGRTEVRVVATIGKTRASEVLVAERAGKGSWRILEARLGE